MKARILSAGALGDALQCTVIGSRDLEIHGIAPILEAGAGDLTFIANPKYRTQLDRCQAGAIIVNPEEPTPQHIVRLETQQPYITFRKALELFYPELDLDLPKGVHLFAAVSSSARVGESVRIGAFVTVESGAAIGSRVTLCHGAFIGRDVIIGDDCVIGISATLRHEVQLGCRVIIGDGTVIGFDGFGYSPEPDGFHKIPQVGTVMIEDDVEIGANCCIDRATIGATRIGKGTKLDNLIQIAHGVHIGANTVIAAQTGISGSTTIGAGVMIGGQAGTVGHIEIGDRMMIGAQAGVTKSFDIKGLVSGYPARPQMEAMRIEAALNKLPGLLKRVRALEEELKKAAGKH